MRLISLAIFFVILFSLSANAVSFTVSSIDANIAYRSESAAVNVTIINQNNNSLTLNVIGSELSNNNSVMGIGSINDLSLNPNEQKAFSFNINVPGDVDLGEYGGSLTFTNSVNSTDVINSGYILNVDDRKLSSNLLDKCDNGVRGNLVVDITEPNNNEDFNPGDEIKTRVKVRNIGNKDLDVQVEAILFNVDEADDIARARSEVKEVRDGTREEFEFFIRVPTTEVDEEDEYILFLKAFEDPDREQLNCQQDFVNVDLDRRSNDIIINEMSIVPSTVECGKTLGARISVENIGKRDQDVSVKLWNTVLGISEVSNQFRLRDSDSDEKDPKNEAVISFDLNIPDDARSGSYVLEGEVMFDGLSSKASKGFIVFCDSEKNVMRLIEKVLVNQIKGMLVEDNISVLSGSSFSLALNIKNELEVNKIVNLELKGIEAFGNVISGDNIVQLQPGESKTVYFYVNTKDMPGMYEGVVDLISDDFQDSVVFSVNVNKAENVGFDFNLAFGIIIILIVVLLLLFWLINRKI